MDNSLVKFVRAKFHGIYVTDANLNYQGSITLDPEYCKMLGIYPMEFVEIWNKNNFSLGRGSGTTVVVM